MQLAVDGDQLATADRDEGVVDPLAVVDLVHPDDDGDVPPDRVLRQAGDERAVERLGGRQDVVSGLGEAGQHALGQDQQVGTAGLGTIEVLAARGEVVGPVRAGGELRDCDDHAGTSALSRSSSAGKSSPSCADRWAIPCRCSSVAKSAIIVALAARP